MKQTYNHIRRSLRVYRKRKRARYRRSDESGSVRGRVDRRKDSRAGEEAAALLALADYMGSGFVGEHTKTIAVIRRKVPR